MSEYTDSVAALIAAAHQKDAVWDELFDLVHECVSRPASDINNSGTDEQLAYINHAGCLIHALDLMDLPADTSLSLAQRAASERVEVDDAFQYDLDDLVHEIASRGGSDINNGGIAGQIEYLVSAGYEAHVREILDQDTQAT